MYFDQFLGQFRQISAGIGVESAQIGLNRRESGNEKKKRMRINASPSVRCGCGDPGATTVLSRVLSMQQNQLNGLLNLCASVISA